MLAYSSLQYLVVRRNQVLIDNLDVWGPEYTISLEINFNSLKRQYNSIFRFSANTTEFNGIGRTPSLMTQRKKPDWLKLGIYDYALDESRFFQVGPFITGTWYNLVFTQRKSLVSVHTDSTITITTQYHFQFQKRLYKHKCLFICLSQTKFRQIWVISTLFSYNFLKPL